jgi:osmotically inducible lipoprotein OsmB
VYPNIGFINDFTNGGVSMTFNHIKLNRTKSNKLVIGLTTALLVLNLSACSNLTTRDKNTIIGASIGAAAGAVLTGGSGIGTAGGAAVGGIIGNQVGKHKK